MSLDSGNIDGTLDSIHDVGVRILILLVEFSKSSIYEALSCVPLLCPAMSWANSPVKEIWEGWVRWRKGSLSRILVSHWLSFFQFTLRPQMVLFSGSLPMLTFEVRACSERCISVPLNRKFLLKSYSQFTPNIVLRSWL